MSAADSPLIIRADYPFTEAALAIRAGRVVAYPTETFYGLAVDPFNAAALERLFTLKGRPADSPVSVIVADGVMLARVAEGVPPGAERLMERFWPGPLTIVFRARPGLPPRLTAGTGKVGVRIPGSPVAVKLLETTGMPLTATSANPSGRPPASTPGQVADYFGPSLDVLIDGGALPAKAPSTVVDVTGPRVLVLRQGAVTEEDITSAIEGGRKNGP
ncbi:MAG: L-threonylcarbamoyladenylate synthase [Thermodesulfobacteriota bacterium]